MAAVAYDARLQLDLAERRSYRVRLDDASS